MSDGSSILGAIADAGKDIAKETVKQAATGATSSIKAAAQQVSGFDTPEEAEKKKADKLATFQRIKQIESEITQIRVADEQKRNAQTAPQSQQTTLGSIETKETKKLDEASRQAVGRAEQGRNFKG